MVTCSVIGCGVNHRNNPDKCTFHRFPLNRIIKGKWLLLIGRVSWSPKKSSSICSKHFPDKYKKKNRINTILLKGAIPTLFVPGQLNERVVSSYVYRDIIPPPSIPPDQEKSVKKRLLLKINKLKQKLQEKQNKIRSLIAKTKRQAEKIVTMEHVLKKIIHGRKKTTDITVVIFQSRNMACNNELIKY